MRWSTEMVEPIKNFPLQKMEILPAGKTRNRVWTKPPRYVNELKSIP